MWEKNSSSLTREEYYQIYREIAEEYSREFGDYHESFRIISSLNLLKSSKILEIGCYSGKLISELKKSGYRYVYGIDVVIPIGFIKSTSPQLLESLVYGDGEFIPIKDSSVDIVLSCDTLEHIPDIFNHLNEVNRVLKPEGMYIIKTPNKLINIIWEIFHSKNLFSWRKYHCSLQTYWGLKKNLKNFGFTGEFFSKGNILSEFNQKKMQVIFGKGGVIILHFLSLLPKQFSPFFWVIAKKKYSLRQKSEK